MLVRLYHEAGIPEGVVRLVQGAAPQGQALSTHAGIDGLLFTGSARTGMMLHRAYAETPNRILALEKIGRASCRERVGQYVKIPVVAVSLKKRKTLRTYTSHSNITYK